MIEEEFDEDGIAKERKFNIVNLQSNQKWKTVSNIL